MSEGKGEPPSIWLANRWITDDQNAESLADLIIKKLSGARRWFRSQIIAPQYPIAYYDSLTEKLVLGLPDKEAMTVITNSVSAQTVDIVITDGEVWEVFSAGSDNQSQNSTHGVFYYDGTTAFPMVSGGSAGGTLLVPGGEGVFPLRILGNGTIAIRYRASTFTAADVMARTLFYRRVK